jgi:hypothetical protein
MPPGELTGMSNKYGPHELTQQGLRWLKSQRQSLIELYQNALPSIPFYRQVEVNVRNEFATRSIDRIIKRLEGSGFNTADLKDSLFVVLEQSPGLQPMLDASDKLEEIITIQVRQQLNEQAQVAEILLKKVQYLNQLSKATMASALIQFESNKNH